MGTTTALRPASTGPGNQAPTVNAGPDLSVTLPDSATLSGTASDDGLPNPPATLTTTWSKVEGTGTVTFGNVGSLSTTASFTEAGTYVLRLTADDSMLTAHDDVTVTVSLAGNQAPTVDAGADQAVILPASAVLAGSVSDDGVPDPPGAVTVTWSKTSGPGAVAFGTGSQPLTTASFSAAGTYVLRLSASDGAVSSWDEALVTVGSPQALLVVGGGEAGDVAAYDRLVALGYVVTGVGGAAATSADAQGKAVVVISSTVDASVVNTKFRDVGVGVVTWESEIFDDMNLTGPTTGADFGTTASQTSSTIEDPTHPLASGLSGTVTVASAASSFSWGVPSEAAARVASIVGSPGRYGVFGYEKGAAMPGLTAHARRVGLFLTDTTAASLTASGWQLFDAAVRWASNTAPQVNAGADQAVSLPASASLAGQATDDGRPTPPGSLTTAWSQVSGPGMTTFAEPTTLTTTASFSTSGTYVLRLTADDSELTGSDELTVVVSGATNQPPAVNAGDDQTIVLPAAAALTGSVFDDGLPNPPGATTNTWSVLEGPGPVTFGDAAALSTTASFSVPGTYRLLLTAHDSELPGSDDVWITVIVNQPPVVDAGPDQNVTLPASANLAGSASDDDLPNPPAAIITTWSKLDGPGTVTFGDPTALSTTASFSTAGTYVLLLTADDSDLQDTDDVAITVTAANQPPTVDAGPDQSITLPATATLAGSALDDGLPNPPGTLTTTWSQVDGLGTVTFGDPMALSTMASFPAPGTYALRLTASDSTLSDFDEVTIEVAAGGEDGRAVMQSPPSGSAFTDSTVTFTWTAGQGVTAYRLDVGTSPGGTEISAGTELTTTSTTVPGLPTNGTTVYTRLWSQIAGNWVHNDYGYTAFTGAPTIDVTAPTAADLYELQPTITISYAPYDANTPLDLETFEVLVNDEDWTAKFTTGPASATYTVGEADRLVAGTLTVEAKISDQADRLATTTATFAVYPTFTAIAPTLADPGDTLTVAADGLDPQGVNLLLFRTPYSQDPVGVAIDGVGSGSSPTVVVPADAITAPVGLRVNERDAPTSFTVAVRQSPYMMCGGPHTVLSHLDGTLTVAAIVSSSYSATPPCPPMPNTSLTRLAVFRHSTDGSVSLVRDVIPEFTPGGHGIEAIALDKAGNLAILTTWQRGNFAGVRELRVEYDGRTTRVPLALGLSPYDSADFDAAGNLHVQASGFDGYQILRVGSEELSAGGQQPYVSLAVNTTSTQFPRRLKVSCEAQAFLQIDEWILHDPQLIMFTVLRQIDLPTGRVVSENKVDGFSHGLALTCNRDEVWMFTHNDFWPEATDQDYGTLWRRKGDGTIDSLQIFPDRPYPFWFMWLHSIHADGDVYIHYGGMGVAGQNLGTVKVNHSVDLGDNTSALPYPCPPFDIQLLPETTRWRPQRDTTQPVEVFFKGPKNLQTSTTLEVTDPNGALVPIPAANLAFSNLSEMPGDPEKDKYKITWSGP